MEQVQKAAHYRSYYESAKKIKNPEAKLAFYEALDAYRFDGIEPENLPFEADLLFTAIRSFIDADLGRKCGGAPAGNHNAKKQPKNNPQNNLLNQPKTNNVEVEVEEEVEGEEKGAFVFSPPQTEVLARDVFETLEAADLPCCNHNLISFTQSDFKYALETIHTRQDLKGLHSNDILGALKNYVQVLENPCTWHGWKAKKSFDRFVSWERFKDFLPDRFCLNNFLEHTEKTESRGVGKEDALRIMAEMGIT